MSWYYLSGILTLSGISLMTVLGLSLLTGFTGLFSFGHAGFMAIGAYTAAILTSNGVPLLVALALGGTAALIAAMLIGRVTLKLKGDYFCIATLGFGESVRLLFDNIDFFGGARGMPGISTYDPNFYLLTVWAINIVAIIVMVSVIKSKHGRNMVAIREEELAAQAIGINVYKYKTISFGMSAVYAGIGGGLLAHYMGYLQPIMFQLLESTEMTIIVIFGGLGSISGSVVGALVLTALPELLRFIGDWRLVIYGAIVILIMIARPQGLMGGKEFTTIFKKLVSSKGGNK